MKIYLSCYHKTGTHFINKLETILKKYDNKNTYIKDIWSHRSNLISSSDDNIKIIHFIRHPYEIICSGVKYHKICTEAWCINNNKNTDADGINYNFNGLTYQKKLQSLNTEDSVNFEKEGRSYNTILDMYNCKFNDYNFCLNVKMEDIYTNLNNTCIKILNFIGIDNSQDICFDSLEINTTDNHVTNKDKQINNYELMFNNNN